MIGEFKYIADEVKKYENIYILGNSQSEISLSKYLKFCDIEVKNFISFSRNNQNNIKTINPFKVIFLNKKSVILSKTKSFSKT